MAEEFLILVHPSLRSNPRQPTLLAKYKVPCVVLQPLRCYTEKATPARHRPERQHNSRSCTPLRCGWVDLHGLMLCGSCCCVRGAALHGGCSLRWLQPEVACYRVCW